MDFSSSFNKKFKSQNSYISVNSVADDDTLHEQQSHRMRESSAVQPMSGSPEFIVKIDSGDRPAAAYDSKKNIWWESSPDLWRNNANNAMQQEGLNQEDPPSKLIGQFLNKQKAAGGEMPLDMDLEMEELRNVKSNYSSPYNFPHGNHNSDNSDHNKNNYDSFPTSKELKVSFQTPDSGCSNVIDIGLDEQKNVRQKNESSSDEDENHRINRRRSLNVVTNEDAHNDAGDEGSVLRCTSVQRKLSFLGTAKNKSRLMDQPEVPERRSEMVKSGQIRSGLLGRASGMLGKPGDDEEDDPLLDEDIPDDYKKAKFDALTIAQWISLVVILIAFVCTLVISKFKRQKLRGLSLWKWEVLVLVLICGRLVSGWGIRIIVFLIERNFFMRKRILYFVYGVRKAVQNCIWLGMVLIAWRYMFDKKVDGNNHFLQYVNKVMLCLLVGTLLWLVKTLMVKVLASSFHVSTFFDRIQESLFNQYVIETLSGLPLIEIQNNKEEEDRTMAEVWRLQNAGATLPPELTASIFRHSTSGKVTGAADEVLPAKSKKGLSSRISGPLKNQDDQGISIDQLHKLNNKNVSAWNMKRLINIVKNGALCTLDERVLDSTQDDEATTKIRSECEAKSAARKIFRNVAKPKSKFIYLEDLMRFLREEEALKTLSIVEGSTESQRISKASLKNWVVNAFRERKALSLTLNDTKTAVKKLHQMVNAIVGIIIVLICLVILGIATSKFLLFISSEIVVVAFIFGNTCKTIFEAVIFVFIIHPFDVGDRCEVEGVQMIVEEMNILTTIFLKADNQKIIYPNVTLATKPISNFYRSPDMGDSVDFTVHIATPAEKIAIMKERITSYIENKSDHWYPSPMVVLMNLEGLHSIKMSVWLRHRMNHQDMGERYTRRALLVEEMIKIFKELDIEYRLYPIDINVRAMPPLNSSRIPSAWATPPGN